MTRTEVRCHCCPASTVVSSHSHGDIARLLAERGWNNTRGVIACKAHAHLEVMPRHRRAR